MKLAAGGAVLLLVILSLLLLNLSEKDYFPYAKTEPPAGPINLPAPTWLPDTISHPCTLCGVCEHKLEVKESHCVLKLHDHDGWYRLFWAGDDTWYYGDPSYFAAALSDPGGAVVEGTWRIQGRYLSPAHDHACGRASGIAGFDLLYRLAFTEVEEGGEAFPERFPWFAYQYKDRIAHFSWERDSETPSDAPCSCSAPTED